MENGQWKPTEMGVPQGGPLSPLLANIVLHDLDMET
jgi:RNA-directed DNA polymerase